ncbi:hypothetical protein HWV62_44925 [Athelia sp. TMB]|nr:hypothetical protein HWV62_44925 [Athelia sp. TMB]
MILYGIGTIISLIGTGFLLGVSQGIASSVFQISNLFPTPQFASQIKSMFKPVRVVASVVFLASIAMIFVSAFVIKNDVICIVFVIVEYLAYTWYTLSYIPYARTAVLKVFGM